MTPETPSKSANLTSGKPDDVLVAEDFGIDTDYNYNPNVNNDVQGWIDTSQIADLEIVPDIASFLHNQGAVENLLSDLTGFSVENLRALKSRSRILRVFVQPEEVDVCKGVRLHISDAQVNPNSAPVLFLGDDAVLPQFQVQSANVLFLKVHSGNGNVTDDAMRKLRNVFPEEMAGINNFSNYETGIIYKLIMSYLGVEKILLGGSHMHLCMSHFAKAAHSLGKPIKLSRYHAV